MAVLNLILFSIIFSLIRLHDFIMFFLFQYLLQNLFNKIIYRYVMLLAIATFTKALRSSQDSLCTRLESEARKNIARCEKNIVFAVSAYISKCRSVYSSKDPSSSFVIFSPSPTSLYLPDSRPHLLALIQFPLVVANAASHRHCTRTSLSVKRRTIKS